MAVVLKSQNVLNGKWKYVVQNKNNLKKKKN
jgi:hypothetical protein